MKKFKHHPSVETKFKQGGVDIVLTIIILFGMSVFMAIWYYQYKVYPRSTIEDQRMKDMQTEYNKLKSEIKKIQNEQQLRKK